MRNNLFNLRSSFLKTIVFAFLMVVSFEQCKKDAFEPLEETIDLIDTTAVADLGVTDRTIVTRKAVMDYVRGQIGKNYTAYGFSGHWCAVFAKHCIGQTGNPLSSSFDAWVNSFNANVGQIGTFIPLADAQEGDLLLFDWTGDGAFLNGDATLDHIAFFEKKTGANTFDYIGGNQGGSGANSWQNSKVTRRTGVNYSNSEVYRVIRPSFYGAVGSPVPATAKFSATPSMVKIGTTLYAAAPLTTGGFMRLVKFDGAWKTLGTVGASSGALLDITMIKSKYGNLEVIGRKSSGRLAFFYGSPEGNDWSAGADLVVNGSTFTNAGGRPALLQGTAGTNGNFEMLVPLKTGGVAHIWRNNDAWGLPWTQQSVIAANYGIVNDVTAMPTSLCANCMEVVFRVGAQTYMVTNHGLSMGWAAPYLLKDAAGVPMANATGNSSLAQGSWGIYGNYELAVPMATGGGVRLFSRNNESGLYEWNNLGCVAQNLGVLKGAAVTEKDKTMDLLMLSGQKLYHMRRNFLTWTACASVN